MDFFPEYTITKYQMIAIVIITILGAIQSLFKMFYPEEERFISYFVVQTYLWIQQGIIGSNTTTRDL